MPRFIDIALTPEEVSEPANALNALAKKGLDHTEKYFLRKRSIDARKKPIVYRLRYEIFAGDEKVVEQEFKPSSKNVRNAEPVHVIGSGPCGLFCALELIEQGLKPIVIERGKDVRSRRRDLAILNKEHIVNPESNYCFGEGGAGTYSDGKLYTRSKKRGDVQSVLRYLVAFGASENILIDAHPHIGTNKLPQIIVKIRKYIENCGGEIYFETKLTDLKINLRKIQAIELNSKEWIPVKNLVLATGHSARDIFHLLYRHQIQIEAKPFALGVRIEHPQTLIDQIQYKCESRGEFLPPASYSLVNQHKEKGVYSFCMCPGGIIAPCATAPGEIVTNGWSPSKRNNPYANSGMVVSIEQKDYDLKNTDNPLAAMEFQSKVEQKAWVLGGESQTAPAQRMSDFVNGVVSMDLPNCSYQPGIVSSDLKECLPDFVHRALRESLKVFGNKMKGYFTNEAVLVATESRTSSPVRIPRTSDLNHPVVSNLFPAGEGAGYAGGIVSAAIDGQRVGRAIKQLSHSDV